MDDAEKHSLRQLSESVLTYPTNIRFAAHLRYRIDSAFSDQMLICSAPLVFTWDGATVTNHFATYEFLRPVSL